jgi:hypothetical protein
MRRGLLLAGAAAVGAATLLNRTSRRPRPQPTLADWPEARRQALAEAIASGSREAEDLIEARP